ncbi:MAG: cmpB [Acidobacteria bacterium]|jgi:NitT/TauT family transport system permease protein|nr:cmpB [Acidobacteriota bacterium]
MTEQAPEKGTGDRVPGTGKKTASGGQLLRIREALPNWLAWLLGVIPIAVLLLIWFGATAGPIPEERMISPTILPSPSEVAASVPQLWFDRALTRNLAVSFVRVLEGFALAVLIAFPLGVLMGSFTKVKAAFNPLTVFGAYLPIPTLVPLTLSLFGTGELQKVVFLALAFAIYLIPLFVAAVDNVDDIYLKTAYTLGADRSQSIGRVLLPISWPDIYQAMRLGFGVGWSYILLAEMVDVGRGIGGIIITSQRRGPREHIYLVLLIIVAVAFLTDRLWVAVGRRLFPYREAKR